MSHGHNHDHESHCQMCILIPLLIFNLVKVVLGFVDFFYRSSSLKNFTVTLFPLVKIAFVVSLFLKISIPMQETYIAHFLLADTVVTGLAFVLSLLCSKGRDRMYLCFLLLVVVENLLTANNFDSFSVWKSVYHNSHHKVLSLISK